MLKKRLYSILIVLSIILGVLPIAASADDTPYFAGSSDREAPILTVLHTNDVHGAFSSTNFLTEKSSGAIGHDVIAGIYAAAKAAVDDAAILLDAGDAVQGVYFVGQSKGQAAIEIMNAVGYDAMTVGNHEFDYGIDRLRELAAMADFPFLTSGELVEDDSFAAYTIIERAGLKIGVFGITTPETEFKSNGGIELKNDGISFGTIETIITDAQETVRALEAEKVDYIICLAHLGIEDMGYGTSYDIRDNVEGIDAIIDGHSHTVLEDIVQKEGAALITSTGSSGANLGFLEFYADGTVKAMSRSASSTVGFGYDDAVTEVIQKWYDTVRTEGSRVVANVPVDIALARANERTRETVMGNIVAEAMLKASGADFALENGGGIRDTNSVLKAGDVTVEQLVTILPFGNVIQMAEVSGAVIKETLEHGVSAYPALTAAFPQVAGVSFTFNPAQAPGDRISEILIGGEPLDPDRTYKMTTNDFTASGGDNYEMLKLPFQTQLSLAMPERASLEQALIGYLNDAGDELVTKTDGRISVRWSFSDLDEDDNELVCSLAVKGIIAGFGDGTFKPDKALTRAEMAAMLVRMLELPAAENDVQFDDIDGGEWYADYALRCASSGLMKGHADGSFGGDETLTIAQLKVLIERIKIPTADIEFDAGIGATRIQAAKELSRYLNSADDAIAA